MKSTFFSILPLVGFALAQEGCTRRTVTKTETEKTTVTVEPSDITITSTIDITTTSTIDITTTITVLPSSVAASVTGLHWGSYPNGTWSNNTARPEPSLPSVSIHYTPTPITETPAPTYVPGQGYSSPSETSSAAVPTSEAPAAVPTSEAPAPAESEAPYEAPVTPNPQVMAKAVARGEATWYGGNTDGGMCSFTGYKLPASVFGLALTDSSWNNANNCGRCVSVTGPTGKKITAMVTDQCPGCGTNNLDLYRDGFAALANPDTGRIAISWDFVPCGITSPLVVKNKTGTSQWWFSMQVINANVAVASLDVSTDAGKTWKKTTRQPYNYFENSAGFGTQSVDVRVTSADGQSIIIKNVSIAPETSKTAASNFK